MPKPIEMDVMSRVHYKLHWFQFPLTLLPQQNKISTNRKVKIKHKNLSRLKSKTKIAHYLLSLWDMGYTWSHLSLEFLNAWKTAKSKAKRKKTQKKNTRKNVQMKKIKIDERKNELNKRNENRLI